MNEKGVRQTGGKNAGLKQSVTYLGSELSARLYVAAPELQPAQFNSRTSFAK